MADLYGTQIVQPVNSVNVLLGTVIVPTSDTVTSGTTANTVNGLMRYVTFKTPAMTATGTATLKITDVDGGTLFTQAQDESGTTTYGSIVPLTDNMNYVVTANGTQAAAGTFTFNLYYER